MIKLRLIVVPLRLATSATPTAGWRYGVLQVVDAVLDVLDVDTLRFLLGVDFVDAGFDVLDFLSSLIVHWLFRMLDHVGLESLDLVVVALRHGLNTHEGAAPHRKRRGDGAD